MLWYLLLTTRWYFLLTYYSLTYLLNQSLRFYFHDVMWCSFILDWYTHLAPYLLSCLFIHLFIYWWIAWLIFRDFPIDLCLKVLTSIMYVSVRTVMLPQSANWSTCHITHHIYLLCKFLSFISCLILSALCNFINSFMYTYQKVLNLCKHHAFWDTQMKNLETPLPV